MRYANVMRLLTETPWAILPAKLEQIVSFVSERSQGIELTPDLVRARIGGELTGYENRRAALAESASGVHGDDAFVFQALAAAGRGTKGRPRTVAVLPIYGSIVPKATIFTEISGGASAERIGQVYDQLIDDSSIDAVVLDIDSPGGMVPGIPELGAKVADGAKRKQVVAVGGPLMASAAYWIASQAGEVRMMPSGQAGSIGVFAAHTDLSKALEKSGVNVTLISAGKHKTEGNPYEALSPEAQAAIQVYVDDVYALFVAAVASGRKTSTRAVESGYGEGRVLFGQAAVDAGLVDKLSTLDETIGELLGAAGASASARAASTASTARAAEPEDEPMDGLCECGHLGSEHAGDDNEGACTHAGCDCEAMDPVEPVTTPGATRHGISLDADRRPDMQEPDKETAHMEPQIEPGAAPATARTDEPARDELFTAVASLSDAVRDMNAGKVDRETIERQAAELEELRKAVDELQPRAGYTPGDDLEALGGVGRKVLGLAELHQLPSKAAAAATGRSEEQIAEFQRVSDNMLLLAAATKTAPENLTYYADTFAPIALSMAVDTATTAEGKEFVPTLLSGDLIARVELQLRVASLFRAMDMPSNPYEIPGFGVRTRGGRAAENTADTGQTGFQKITPLTRKITLTAVKFAAEALVSKEAEEDSLIPILDFIRGELTSQLAFDIEDAIINGDTTGTHQDTDVTAALDPRKNWMGLRKLIVAGAKTDGANAVLTAAMLRTNRKKMGKYGVDPLNVAHVIGIGQYINLLADPSVITLEKYGPNATILTGELAKVDGISIIVSEYVRADLNATAVFDNVTTNRSEAITVNTNAFMIGNRRGMTVQLLKELYAEYDQDAIAVSLRKAFVCRQVATDTTAALTYNLAA